MDIFVVALRAWNPESVSILVEKFGLDPSASDKDGAQLLHHFAGRDDVRMCQLLLTKFAVSPNIQDSNGQTPLHWFAKGKTETQQAARMLLNHGASLTLEDNAGRKPVDYAP